MKASCQCGQLTVEVPGPTPAVVACHCIACQKRTGSPFGVAAYYPHAEVKVAGEARRFDRPTALGGMFENYFCPDCGTNLYFRGGKNPDFTGVAIGCFDEPHDMAPVRSVWEQSQHSWVTVPSARQHFDQSRH